MTTDKSNTAIDPVSDAQSAATNGRLAEGSPASDRAALTQEAAQDALAAGLEHVDGLGLADVQKWTAAATRRTEAPLTDKALAAACRTVRFKAAAALENKHPDATPEQIQEALDEALRPADPITSKAVDLGALMRGGVPPVDYLDGPLARGMVYAKGVTGFAGHPKSGKTFLAVRLAVDAMRAGRHAVWLDWENGPDEALRKLDAVGAEPALLSERLTYVPFPGQPDWHALGRHWDEHPDALGVWDSTRGILKSLNLKENEADAGIFIDDLAQFSLTRGIASILLDHVTKSETGTTGYARGTGDKLAGVQAQWFVKQQVPFSEAEIGEMELTRWAARSGRLAYRHAFKVGDGNGGMPFRRLNADETPEGKAEQAIIDYLKASAPDGQSLRAIEADVGGTAAVVRERVKALAEAEDRPVTATADSPPRFVYAAELDQEPGTRGPLEL